MILCWVIFIVLLGYIWFVWYKLYMFKEKIYIYILCKYVWIIVLYCYFLEDFIFGICKNKNKLFKYKLEYFIVIKDDIVLFLVRNKWLFLDLFFLWIVKFDKI